MSDLSKEELITLAEVAGYEVKGDSKNGISVYKYPEKAVISDPYHRWPDRDRWRPDKDIEQADEILESLNLPYEIECNIDEDGSKLYHVCIFKYCRSYSKMFESGFRKSKPMAIYKAILKAKGEVWVN